MIEVSKQERLENRLQPQIKEFREERQTLILSTISSDGFPHVSYSPFTRIEHNYYVLISEIAEHTRNLQAQPKLSFMLAEDEANCKQLYARKRLTYKADASIVARDTAEWQQATAQLQARFGEIIDNLSQLSDFKLFKLTPSVGRFVKGFGQAYTVQGNDDIDFVHLDQGHTKITADNQA